MGEVPTPERKTEPFLLPPGKVLRPSVLCEMQQCWIGATLQMLAQRTGTHRHVQADCCQQSRRRLAQKEPHQAGWLDVKMLSHKEEHHGSARSGEESSCLSQFHNIS